jgi:hypothetical protein
MSDAVIIVALICATSLGIHGTLCIVTYKKDKLSMHIKNKFASIAETETAITAEDDEENAKKR